MRIICSDPRHNGVKDKQGSEAWRIAGINIPPHQHAGGLWPFMASVVRAHARFAKLIGIDYSKIKDLTDQDLEKIREALAQFTLESDLRREVTMNIALDGCVATLPWLPSSPWPACAWSAYTHQCTHSQRARKAAQS